MGKAWHQLEHPEDSSCFVCEEWRHLSCEPATEASSRLWEGGSSLLQVPGSCRCSSLFFPSIFRRVARSSPATGREAGRPARACRWPKGCFQSSACSTLQGFVRLPSGLPPLPSGLLSHSPGRRALSFSSCLARLARPPALSDHHILGRWSWAEAGNSGTTREPWKWIPRPQSLLLGGQGPSVALAGLMRGGWPLEPL